MPGRAFTPRLPYDKFTPKATLAALPFEISR